MNIKKNRELFIKSFLKKPCTSVHPVWSTRTYVYDQKRWPRRVVVKHGFSCFCSKILLLSKKLYNKWLVCDRHYNFSFKYLCRCGRLGLTSLAYLWRRNQEELLNEIIKCDVRAILIKVAALGKHYVYAHHSRLIISHIYF